MGLIRAQQSPLEQARALYQKTDYAGTLAALKSVPPSVEAQVLEGQCRFMQRDFKRAIELFEKAVAAQPKNSDYALWLGRAWGRRAESSNVFQAPGFARNARDAFEKAVQLNPRNVEAISDLFSYYTEAPGFLGGGDDKAAKLADTIKSVNPAEYEYFQAQLAMKRKQDDAAEKHLRRAFELDSNSVGRLCDVASFVAKRGRFDESMKLFAQAAKMASSSPKWRYAQAKALVESKQNYALARQLLDEYLKGPLTPDDPSREEAQELRKRASK